MRKITRKKVKRKWTSNKSWKKKKKATEKRK